MTATGGTAQGASRHGHSVTARFTTLVLLFWLAPPPALSQTNSADSAVSHWGVIPARADSVVTTVADRPMPLWESVLVWPYRVLGFPFTVFRAGVGASITTLEGSPLARTLGSLFGPRRGPFGIVGTVRAGGLAGLGGGLRLEHDAFPSAPSRARFGFESTFEGDHKLHLGFRMAPGGTANLTEIGAGFRIRSESRYFGVGPGSARRSESEYRHASWWVGASQRVAPSGGSAFVEIETIVSRVGSSPSTGDDPSLEEVFVNALPPGWNQESDAVTLAVALHHADAAEEARPNRGGSRRVRAAISKSLGGPPFAAMVYRADFEQFFRLWFPDHVLAARAYASWIDPAGANPLPFQRLMTNNDPDLLRGYRDFRWRDRGMVALTVEYRWPLWAATRAHGPGADIYLLGDVGQVFGSVGEIQLSHMTTSVGGGIRIVGGRGLLGRVEVARSEEEWVFRLRGDQVFQFARHGLFHGRNPIPRR